MSKYFENSYIYCVGIDTPADADEGAVAEFNEFYGTVHVPEVLANNPAFSVAHRYELSKQDSRGQFGPRWLAVYETDAAGARRYIDRDESTEASDKPIYTPGPDLWSAMSVVWRVIWRRTHQVGTRPSALDSIFMVGMDVPSDANDEELEQFNGFYSSVHVPEVLKYAHYPRGTRYEADWRPEAQRDRVPRFCAVYEADADAARESEEAWAKLAVQTQSDVFSSGPRAWEDRVSAWRLTYKRLAM